MRLARWGCGAGAGVVPEFCLLRTQNAGAISAPPAMPPQENAGSGECWRRTAAAEPLAMLTQENALRRMLVPYAPGLRSAPGAVCACARTGAPRPAGIEIFFTRPCCSARRCRRDAIPKTRSRERNTLPKELQWQTRSPTIVSAAQRASPSAPTKRSARAMPITRSTRPSATNARASRSKPARRFARATASSQRKRSGLRNGAANGKAKGFRASTFPFGR